MRNIGITVTILATIALRCYGAPPAGFQNETLIASGLNFPTAFEFLPDGRMIITQFAGRVVMVQPGAAVVDSTPVLQLTNVINEQVSGGGERGLTNVLIDPGFATNGYFYLFYTAGSPQRDRVSRFTMTGNTASLASEVVIWQAPGTSQSTDHHGGGMTFGPDGKLYIAHGDDNNPNACQSLTAHNGKLIRINPDGTVPTDNPFYDGTGPNLDAIWARGLRNPFRLHHDVPTGRMFVSDVGFNTVEEINVVVRGANYGWPNAEGPSGTSGLTNPLYSWNHNNRDAAALGGVVYRGSQFPASYQGVYFFMDYAQNTIQYLTLDASGNLTGVFNFEPANGAKDTASVGDPVCIKVGPDGALYYLDIGLSWSGGGVGPQHPAAVHRIRYAAANQPPSVNISASPTSGPAPLTVNFSSAGSVDPEGAPLTYAWTFGDGGTSTQANPQHTYTQAGPYLARLAVSDGVNVTQSSVFGIQVGNAPTGVITGPSSGSFFRAGDTISFSGTATDVEDGTLPASAFSWTVRFLHGTHAHPVLGPLTGVTSSSFAIPASGHDFALDTSYEILLTVTDSHGLTSTVSSIIRPEIVNLNFATVPSGLTLRLNGIDRVTPFVEQEVVGFQLEMTAPHQSGGGNQYNFVSWSDGGAQTHPVVVPASGGSYTATYQVVAVQPTGLVAAYNFNESGTSLPDLSGNNNNGTVNGPVWTSAGKNGGAFTFDGVNDLITIAHSSSLNLTTGMSLQAWVYPTVNTGVRDILIKEGTNVDIYNLYHRNSAGRPESNVYVGGSNRVAQGPAALTVNTWTHLCATYDGAVVRLFVNGTQAAATNYAGSIATSTGAVRLGGNSLWGEYFQGRIDDVRIYNRALTAAEIQSDMNKPVSLPVANTPPAISNLADQFTGEDLVLEDIAFTVVDAETAPGNLAVTASSSNSTLVPAANLVLGGSGANRTLAINPAPDQNGTATITVTVSDGASTASDTFLLNVLPVNDPPSVSDIGNQVTEMNTPTAALAFTVGDPETPPCCVDIIFDSSNPTLIPIENLILGGSLANRTVTVNPAPGQVGTATITVTISDGELAVSDTFTVLVTPMNTPPGIVAPADQSTNEDTPLGPIAFTVGDAETAPAALAVSATSNNPDLIPNGNITLTGAGPDRFVSVVPLRNQSGTATITLNVSDGAAVASASFQVTVLAVNDAPGITPIANQTIAMNGSAGPLSFSVSDVESAPGALTVTAASDNEALLPVANIVMAGTGANRTVTLTPAPGAFGVATILLTASDGELSATTSFTLTVNELVTGTRTFDNTTAIILPANGAATPYPSSIVVSGMGGTITDLNVVLKNMTHTNPDDIDILLVGPGGQKLRLLSDAGGTNDISNVTLTFDDAAAAGLTNGGQITTGTYRPSNFDTNTDGFPAPAPATPYTAVLSTFNNLDANGTWQLFVRDDANGNQGTIAGGWSLIVTTLMPGTPTISDIPDQSVAVGATPSPVPFTVGDSNTPLANLVLSGSSSNPALLPNANIVFGGSGASRTVTLTPELGQTGSATVTVTVSDGALSAIDTLVLTVSPAPTGGLVAAYNFDEGAGTTLTDHSGIGNGGTLSGPTWTTAGKNGGALTFDGVNDMVTVADSASLDLTTGMTLEAWIYPTVNTGTRDVLIKEGTGVDVYNLYHRNWRGLPEGNVLVGGTNRTAEGTALPVNTWTHLAATYDGAVLRFFVNGSQAAATSIAGSITTSTAPLRIGGNALWTEFFQGRIDDVRIYNRALSVAEIQSDMTIPVSPPQSGTQSLRMMPEADTSGDALATTTATAQTFAASPPVESSSLPTAQGYLAAADGNYTGLLSGPDGQTLGLASLTLTRKAVTLSFNHGKAAHTFRGTLSARGAIVHAAIPRPGAQPLTLNLQLGLTAKGGFRLTGTLADGTQSIDIRTDRQTHNATNPSPNQGIYTLLIPAPEGMDSQTAPGGHGFATATVDAAGKVTAQVTLGDGTRLSVTGAHMQDGEWPVYSPLYAGKGDGKVAGLVEFRRIPNVSDLDGLLEWTKGAEAKPQAASVYPKGFTLQPSLMGSLYRAPMAASQEAALIGLVSQLGNAELEFLQGGLNPAIAPLKLNWSGTNAVTLTTPVPKLTFAMTVTAATGAVTGSYIQNGVNPVQRVAFNGVIYQRQGLAGGNFIQKQQSGAFTIYPSGTPSLGVSVEGGSNLESGQTLEVGAEDLSLRLTNHGDGALLLDPAALDSPSKRFALVTERRGYLAPGQSCLLQVRFQPVTEGEDTARLTLFSNDPEQNPFTVNLSGNGNASAEKTGYPALSPLSLNTAKHGGAYDGLVTQSGVAAGATAGTGKFSLSGTALSGTVNVHGVALTLRGTVRPDGSYAPISLTGGAGYVLDNLALGQTAGGGVSLGGTLRRTSDGSSYDLRFQRLPFTAAAPTPLAGTYTFLLPADPLLGDGYPAGHGSGALTLTADGKLTANLVLGDGERVTYAGAVGGEGWWFFHLPLYAAKGALSGAIQFQDLPGVSDFDGTLAWKRPANPASAIFPFGFQEEATLMGSRYKRTAGAASLTLRPGPGNAGLEFSGAGLPGPLDLSWAPANTVTLAKPTPPHTLTLSVAANGMVTGTVGNSLTKVNGSLSGVVFQKQNLVGGAYLKAAAPAQTGSFQIMPR